MALSEYTSSRSAKHDGKIALPGSLSALEEHLDGKMSQEAGNRLEDAFSRGHRSNCLLKTRKQRPLCLPPTTALTFLPNILRHPGHIDALKQLAFSTGVTTA
jgi:hypothetical protein